VLDPLFARSLPVTPGACRLLALAIALVIGIPAGIVRLVGECRRGLTRPTCSRCWAFDADFFLLGILMILLVSVQLGWPAGLGRREPV